MEGESINTRFSKIIHSLGYSAEDMQKYVKRFDIPHKIQTIASAFSFSEKKKMIVECLGVLKTRNSLTNLLFLRYTLETIFQTTESSNDGLWQCFESNNGISILKCCYSSVNRTFLNNLSELLISIQRKQTVCYDFLPLLLKKYELINKRLIFSFINLNIDRSALVLPVNVVEKGKDTFTIEEYTTDSCYCFTFLKRIVEDVFELPQINDELKFIQVDGFEIHKIISKEKWLRSKAKFSNLETYNNLMNFKPDKTSFIMKTVNRVQNNITFLPNVSCNGVCVQESSNSQRRPDGKVFFIDQDKEKKDKSGCFVSKECSNTSLELLKSSNEVPKTGAAQYDLDHLKKELELIKFENLTLKCKLDKEVTQKKVVSYSFNHASTFNNKDSQVNSSSNETSTANLIVEPSKISSLFKGKSGLFKKSAVQSSSNAISEVKADNTDSTLGKIEKPVTALERSSIFKGKGGLFGKKKVEEQENGGASSQEVNQAAQNFGARFGAKSKPQPSILSTTQSYIGLKWKKTNKAQSQIFSKIDYSVCEKNFELEEFKTFASKPEKKESRLSDTQRQASEMQKPVSYVIDPKKSYALNIALGRVKLSNEELIDKILKQEYENENIVKQLLTYFLTQEEYESVCSTTMELSRAEKLFKALPNFKRFHSALLSQRFCFSFKARDYKTVIANMKLSFEKLVKSEEIPKLFGVLLVIGNVLNSNTFNGNAEGFSLESLEMFATKDVFELVKRKIDSRRLLKELLGTENPAKVLLMNSEISVETLIYEINEIKAISGDFVSEDVSDEYKQVLIAFEDLFGLYKEAQRYFGVSDDSFIVKIESFLRKLCEHL